MKLYQKLKSSGNPTAPVQLIISLLEKYPVSEVAKIVGVSPRWVYKIRQRFIQSNGSLSACILKKGPKNPMPNRTPKYIEDLVVELAKATNF
ncbi:helix-turn-helix domain-containing protein, partial [Carboxydothermus pertinax]